jgi:hypothetical protein
VRFAPASHAIPTVAVSNRTFLEALFVDALPGTYTIVCGFPGDPHTVDRGAWFGRPWSPGSALPWWLERDRNAYLTVSEFEVDPNTGECRRRKDQFVSMHAVMVDDLGYGMGSKVDLSKLALPPSVLVETSPSNFQAYYFLTQDAESRTRSICERTVDAMVAAGLTVDGSDPGMKGVTRYGRLPCGINGKSKYVKALGRPFQVRCVEFEPARRYTLAQIRAAWKLTLAPAALAYVPRDVSPELVAQATNGFDALLALLKALGHYKGQQGVWHHVVCPWVDSHGWKDEARGEKDDTGTAIAAPSQANNYYGGFRCWHGHCSGDTGPRRSMRDVWAWVRELADNINTQGAA